MNQSCFLIGYSSGQGGPVADQGEGPGGSAPLILDQTEAQKAVKNFVRDRLSPPPPRPTYLKAWILHCGPVFLCISCHDPVRKKSYWPCSGAHISQ